MSQYELTESNEQPVVETPKRTLALRTQLMLVIALVSFPVSALVIYQSGSNKPVQPQKKEQFLAEKNSPEGTTLNQNERQNEEAIDKTYRQQAIGIWEKEESGKRVLTIKDDGTATLIYFPTGFNSYFLAKKVTIQIEWKIDKGEVTFNSVSGIPQASFDIITAKHGRERIRKITKVTDDYFVFYDEKDKEESKWTRVPEAK